MKFILLLLTPIIITACSWLHPQENFEMERLSSDVLSSKSGRGISISITPIEEPRPK